MGPKSSIHPPVWEGAAPSEPFAEHRTLPTASPNLYPKGSITVLSDDELDLADPEEEIPMIDTNRLALGIHPNSVLSVAEMVECARLAETKGSAATWVAEGHRGDVFALLRRARDEHLQNTAGRRNPARTCAQPL